MRPGLVAFPKPPEEYIAFAVQHGASHLEIDLFGPDQWLERFHSARVRELRRLVQQAGLTCSFHTPYVLNLADYLPYIRARAVEYVTHLLRIAGEADALWVTVHPGYGIGIPTLDWVRSKALDSLRRSLDFLLPFAEKLKVPLALENVSPSPPGSEIIFLLDSPEEMAQVLNKASSPYLKVCLDVGHAVVSGDLREFLRVCKDRLVGAHIHDNDGKDDLHLVPGQGVINWQQVLSEFLNAGFNGVLNIEVYDDTDKAKGLCFLKRLIGEITGSIS
ncbi:MAG: sugar phosphate isomerase/epimerase [Armatimonadetes bacterium]|nr:sugar phosphate isomerase/epimerase [Armatimonadota bacterium]MDW8121476.1 sugar phosphate isomerase/epimerase [Armatimonadota bacterium]